MRERNTDLLPYEFFDDDHVRKPECLRIRNRLSVRTVVGFRNMRYGKRLLCAGCVSGDVCEPGRVSFNRVPDRRNFKRRLRGRRNVLPTGGRGWHNEQSVHKFLQPVEFFHGGAGGG